MYIPSIFPQIFPAIPRKKSSQIFLPIPRKRRIRPIPKKKRITLKQSSMAKRNFFSSFLLLTHNLVFWSIMLLTHRLGFWSVVLLLSDTRKKNQESTVGEGVKVVFQLTLKERNLVSYEDCIEITIITRVVWLENLKSLLLQNIQSFYFLWKEMYYHYYGYYLSSRVC